MGRWLAYNQFYIKSLSCIFLQFQKLETNYNYQPNTFIYEKRDGPPSNLSTLKSSPLFEHAEMQETHHFSCSLPMKWFCKCGILQQVSVNQNTLHFFFIFGPKNKLPPSHFWAKLLSDLCPPKNHIQKKSRTSVSSPIAVTPEKPCPFDRDSISIMKTRHWWESNTLCQQEIFWWLISRCKWSH